MLTRQKTPEELLLAGHYPFKANIFNMSLWDALNYKKREDVGVFHKSDDPPSLHLAILA